MRKELGQRIRSRSSLESIIKSAGLTIVKSLGPENLHPTMLPVVVWALAPPSF